MKLQRLSFLILFTGMSLFSIKAQTYGFEWIKPWQPYYKFKIAKEGLYRIDSITLASIGLNLSAINPVRFQLYRDGEEQAVYVEGSGDGVFNSTDFIEFYARPNDGKLDAEFYQNPANQPHQYNSLITDTAFYFFTVLADTAIASPKRVQVFSDLNYSGYTPEPYFTYSQVVAPVKEYCRGVYERVGQAASEVYYFSDYDDGESWTGLKFGLGEFKVDTFPTPLQNTLGPLPIFEAKFIGLSDAVSSSSVNHHLRVSVSAGSGYTIVKDTTYAGLIQTSYHKTLAYADIGATSTFFRYENIPDLGIGSDYSALSYLKLSYSRDYNLSGKTKLSFSLKPVISAARSYLRFSNYGGSSPILVDYTNNKRIACSLVSGELRALLENNSPARELFICDASDVIHITQLQAVDVSPVSTAENYEFILVSHENLTSAATQYRDYRSQRFKTLLVNSTRLYDLYYYGYPSPLALKRFCKHLYQAQAVKPSYLLLLGRGYQNNLTRLNFQESYAKNLVPAIGEPSSDNLFTTGLDVSTPFAPAIATGRIPAATVTEALNYLDKLKYYETHPDSIQEWRKNVLHLSGGAELGEQLFLKGILDSYKNIISGKSFGARVTSYNKNSSQNVDPGLKNYLVAELNKGKTLMTFLGHGSLTVLDVDFGSISDLSNTGKYCFFYFNGCNVGNANDLDPLGSGNFYGKDYLCARDKGAIGWLAHSNITLSNNLQSQMYWFYNGLSVTHYGLPIGKVVQNLIRQNSTGSSDRKLITQGYQLLLQCDPAVKLYSPALPDYEVKDNYLFVPEGITAQSDSFPLMLIVKNLGKAQDDTLALRIVHTLPGSASKYTYDSFSMVAPFFNDTLMVWLKGRGSSMAGENIFDVVLDKNNSLTESNENNNSAQLKYFIPFTGLVPLSPPEFGVLHNDTLMLVSQNSDLFAQNKEYFFELDTSPYFNSLPPFHMASGSVTGNDLAKWKTILPASDSAVYFWRSRINLPFDQGGAWTHSSFTYIKNATEGYRQSHFHQYSQSASLSKLKTDTLLRRIEFVDNEMTLGIENKRFDHRLMGVTKPYLLNAGVGSCIGEGIVALVFEPYQIDFPYELPNYPFNCAYVQANKYSQSIRYYPFATNSPAGESDFRRFIDSVPAGYYVAIFSRYGSYVHIWDSSTRNALYKLGAFKVQQVRNKNTAWALIGQKGATVGFAVEDTVTNDSLGALVDANLITLPPLPNEPQDVKLLRIEKPLVLKWYTGSLLSKPFGPAKEWNRVSFTFNSADAGASDKKWVDVYGVKKDGTDSLLVYHTQVSPVLLNTVDANILPFIHLKVTFEDSAKRTPQQFGYWQVDYKALPEAKLSPSVAYEFRSNPIQQGDSLYIKIGIQNLSNIPYDSNLVVFSIADENRLQKVILSKPSRRIGAFDSLSVEAKLPTLALSGNNLLKIQLNAARQPEEMNYLNNYLTRSFVVQPDKTNPFLDVTFDGVHIMNNDIVSSKPVIRITSTDDNKVLMQKDTGVFMLMLKKPWEFTYQRIPIGSPEVQFEAATGANNKASVVYSPARLDSNGTYSLRVQSTDASGNTSASGAYEVDFQIIKNRSISHFYPYPNPGTTKIRFVFTLTGDKAPDDLLIRILTVSGKVVREINRQEFGNIHVGNNISEFAWDGTDMFGDRLANGVYLYQVFTRIEGNDLTNYKTSNKNESNFFLNNTGKIYLMK